MEQGKKEGVERRREDEVCLYARYARSVGVYLLSISFQLIGYEESLVLLALRLGSMSRYALVWRCNTTAKSVWLVKFAVRADWSQAMCI